MKTFWIPLTLLVALLIALMYNVRYLEAFIEPLNEELAAAEQLAQEGGWEAAEARTRAVYDAWHEKRTYLHITLRHDNLDNVYVLLEQVLAYLSEKKMDEYRAANQALITRLMLLCEMEELSLHNIL